MKERLLKSVQFIYADGYTLELSRKEYFALTEAELDRLSKPQGQGCILKGKDEGMHSRK